MIEIIIPKTQIISHIMHTRTSSNCTKTISKLETLSTTTLQPRPSGSISPVYRDNLFTIDPPSYTSESKHVDGRQRSFLGGQTSSRPSVQYSNRLASTSGSNPRTGGGGGSSRRAWRRPRGKSHRRQAEEERREASVSSIYRFWITWWRLPRPL